MEGPTSCDQCGIAVWAVLGKIEYCPDCDMCLCPACWNDPQYHKCIIPDEEWEDEPGTVTVKGHTYHF